MLATINKVINNIGAKPRSKVLYPDFFRGRVLGEPEGEVLIPGYMFDFSWTDGIDKTMPSMITVIGVFQYFHENQVRTFIEEVRNHFDEVELLFDAMTMKAINYAANYIRTMLRLSSAKW